MRKINRSLFICKSFSKSISSDNYHNIYFRGDVNLTNIKILTRIVQEQNQKYINTNKKILNKNPIKLHITSHGGDVDAGLLAYDLIKLSRFPIYTFANSYVFSSATYIFLAGKQRFMTPHTYFLIHNMSYDISGKHNDIGDYYRNNQIITKDVEKIYLNETNLKLNLIKHLLKREKFLTPDECIKYGIVNKILK